MPSTGPPARISGREAQHALRNHFERLLGSELQELIRLAEAALVALDKPGTRGLHRKIDSGFSAAVRTCGALRLVDTG